MYLSISNNKIIDKICSYCNKPFTNEFWCKECDPRCIIEGWSSGNPDIDMFIKATIYNVRHVDSSPFLEWVSFDKFTDINQIGEGGFSKVYSAIWMDGKSSYKKRNDESWIKLESEPIKVALKKLNGSQNMSTDYLNKIKVHWNLYSDNPSVLKFYGMTKDPETEEFMMILQFVNKGNLRDVLLNKFNYILWKDKIQLLLDLISDLQDAHRSGQVHKNFHSGNILRNNYLYHISDFGLFGSANESDNKICGVLPYIAPEVLIGKPYTSSSDIYSFGIIMVELSSGYPPFHNRKHDYSLALKICNGLRPNFGSETPYIYKKLAHKCMNANSNERPKAEELYCVLNFWNNILYKEKIQEKKIQNMFNKKIPNISTFYKKNPDAIYISRKFIFNKFLPEPINSPIIISYYLEENINDENSYTDYGECSYCNKPFIDKELWCEECDPYKLIEGWTSGNHDLDNFIKDTIYNARNENEDPILLEWVPFGKLIDKTQIDTGGFSVVYNAIWYKSAVKRPNYKVALKKLNGSENMSTNYFNKIKTYWKLSSDPNSLKFYGMTRDPETKEFMMILQFADKGNLRNTLSNNFDKILWKYKIKYLHNLIHNLQNAHKKGHFHKNFHSGNILLGTTDTSTNTYIADFGLIGPSNEQKSDDKIYGVLPYIAPEVLNGKSYTSSSDIYSFGVIMAELSSGNPPFHDRNHDLDLASNICDGLRPEFGKGTPYIYKKLAHKCMNANSNVRPTAEELYRYLNLWNDVLHNDIILSCKEEKIQNMFNKKIPNISTTHEKNPDATYISREFTFNNLPNPVNSPTIISHYLKENINDMDYNTNYGVCIYCNEPYINEELWCEKCDLYPMLEGWTSGNRDIDKLIIDAIYNAINKNENSLFLEWVPFNRLTDIKQIDSSNDEYIATWIDGHSSYKKYHDGNCEKLEPESIEVALTKLKGSQNMIADYLKKIKVDWNRKPDSLRFYGITRDLKTNELMLIMAYKRSLLKPRI
ncbi:kinase-like protein [Rhizophagus irregularis]|uniref:Kinase-like protein n=1 Tax=Rhizophagus irregularis TaxID=588596 RepID=A0A2I1GIZ1_9GLOM|nr:kinase-like protein [Rhizophagus irregularis]